MTKTKFCYLPSIEFEIQLTQSKFSFSLSTCKYPHNHRLSKLSCCFIRHRAAAEAVELQTTFMDAGPLLNDVIKHNITLQPTTH